jgi:hypothetical protein
MISSFTPQSGTMISGCTANAFLLRKLTPRQDRLDPAI